jgi:tetrapyrrole methylase family protein/MazG family protein
MPADQDTPELVEAIAFLSGAVAQNNSWLQGLSAAEIALFASENAVGEVPDSDRVLPWRAPLPPVPMVITGFRAGAAEGVRRWLGRYYPQDHTIVVRYPRPGSASVAGVRSLRLHDLEQFSDADGEAVLVVPPLPEMENVRTFAGMMQLTRRLRGPGGCPWDREQSHATLKPYLLEEAYEVLDALDGGDPRQIAEELGDLLYQITIHSQVAAEEGTFTIEDVIESIMVKLIGRHPHVFGDREAGTEPRPLQTAQDVRHAWESFKQQQKPKRESILEEIPRGLPALPQSNLMQKRAASVGFAWPGVSEVIAKAAEELQEFSIEIESGASKDQQREELGDLLFALVGVARQLKIDPEEVLRGANRKFAERFAYLEARARQRGIALREMSTDDMLGLWKEAKG